MEEKKQPINIELKPEVARGSYSNLAIVSHSKSEFCLDFAAMLPGLPKAQVNSRIIMAPEHCKRLLNALADNVSRYEAQFGPIEISGQQAPKGATFNIEDFNPHGTKS